MHATITQMPERPAKKCERRANMMEIRFDRTGAERKALVAAISEVTGVEAKYIGAPSFAYSVGGNTITRDGTLEADGGEDIASLLAPLAERGFVPTEALNLTSEDTKSISTESVTASSTGDIVAIELPDEGFTDLAFGNLVKLVAGKATLIRKALGSQLGDGAEGLSIVRVDGKICFPWFKASMGTEEYAAWSCFAGALCTTAKTQKRVILKEKPMEEGASEKFAMRCFLLKLGFIGEEYKEARKTILAGLLGDGSHKKPKRAAQQEEAAY